MAEQAQVTNQQDVDDAERGPTMHVEMVAIITAAVMSALRLETITEAVHIAVRQHMGGRRIYVPLTDAKIVESEIRNRDEAVRRAYNGRNMPEVCKAFGLSRSSFYRAINPRARKTAKKRALRKG